MYESDHTLFIKALKEKNPGIEAGQQQGRALLWDRPPVSLDEQERQLKSAVKQQARPTARRRNAGGRFAACAGRGIRAGPPVRRAAAQAAQRPVHSARCAGSVSRCVRRSARSVVVPDPQAEFQYPRHPDGAAYAAIPEVPPHRSGRGSGRSARGTGAAPARLRTDQAGRLRSQHAAAAGPRFRAYPGLYRAKPDARAARRGGGRFAAGVARCDETRPADRAPQDQPRGTVRARAHDRHPAPPAVDTLRRVCRFVRHCRRRAGGRGQFCRAARAGQGNADRNHPGRTVCAHLSQRSTAHGLCSHHGQPARRPPVADAPGAQARRSGGRVDLRQPPAVRPQRRLRQISAHLPGRRGKTGKGRRVRAVRAHRKRPVSGAAGIPRQPAGRPGQHAGRRIPPRLFHRCDHDRAQAVLVRAAQGGRVRQEGLPAADDGTQYEPPVRAADRDHRRGNVSRGRRSGAVVAQYVPVGAGTRGSAGTVPDPELRCGRSAGRAPGRVPGRAQGDGSAGPARLATRLRVDPQAQRPAAAQRGRSGARRAARGAGGSQAGIDAVDR
uniref:DUF3460 family protein n=1 Tax=Tanacetum cinerariifolium TaxID=118510 RepID=A0A699GME0_TANCI|nr:hypothetical protein [Tanacetum cinerariifolium]